MEALPAEMTLEVIVALDADAAGMAPPTGLDVTMFALPQVGISEPKNHPVAASRGDVLLFANDDVAPEPGFVAAHVAAQRDGHTLVLSCSPCRRQRRRLRASLADSSDGSRSVWQSRPFRWARCPRLRCYTWRERAMSSPGRVRRTAEWVEREYGREKWPAVLDMIRRMIAAETPDAGLSRVLARVNRAMSTFESSGSWSDEVVIGGARVRAPRTLASAAHQSIVVEGGLAACSDETDLIVELGSGWGRNVFALWLAGAPRSATYIGAEYTAVGRKAADTLATLVPEMRFESRGFDFNKLTLDTLPPARHAVVFTVHSVEQIPYIGGELTSFIAALAPEVDCIHLEPVGWQLDSGEPTWSSRQYAEQNDYNRDLVDVLQAAEDRGDIRIVRVEPEAIGIRPANTTTFIHWRSRGGVIPDSGQPTSATSCDDCPSQL